MSFDEYCEDRGYITEDARAKHFEFYKIQKATGWKCPNSIDVHSVHKVRDLAAYLIKYFIKNDESRRHVEGNIWRLSEMLSKFKGCCEIISGKIADELQFLTERTKILLKTYDYCTILKTPMDMIIGYLQYSELVKKFKDYVANILDPPQLILVT
jgi:hypothetical protein